MPGGSWIWLGFVSPVLWAVWAFWPARATVVLDLGAQRQRVRLRLRFLGVQAAVEGFRSPAGGPGGHGSPGSAIASVRVRLSILGLVRIQRRLRTLERVVHGEGFAAWIRALWSDPSGDSPSIVGRLRTRMTDFRIWAPWMHRIGGVLRRHLTVHRLHVRFALGTGDAAATAWAAGAAWALGGMLWQGVSRGARFTAPPAWRVEPVFHTSCLRLRVNGRVTMRQGWLGWMGGLALAGALARRRKKEQNRPGTGS